MTLLITTVNELVNQSV